MRGSLNSTVHGCLNHFLITLGVDDAGQQYCRCVAPNHGPIFGFEGGYQHDLFLHTRRRIPWNPNAIRGTQLALREVSRKLFGGEAELLVSRLDR